MIVIVSNWWIRNIASLAYRLKGSSSSYSAQSLLFFIILREESMRSDKALINHERIHFRQQVELLFIFHWILYGGFYIYHLIRLQGHEAAYHRIPFEREAYEFEGDLSYLRRRKLFSWLKFL